MRTPLLLALLLTTLAGASQAAEYMPAKGWYVGSDGLCVEVTVRDKTAREFSLSSGDVCKPGLDSPGGAEERSFRCVAHLSGGSYGYWGVLKRGGAPFTVQGDTTFAFDTAGLVRTQQQYLLITPVTYAADTEGACATTLQKPSRRLR